MKKPFQKPEPKQEPRPVFRAMLVVDPQNIAAAQLQFIEGDLQLDELAGALGSLHAQCLIQFGVTSEQKRAKVETPDG